MLGMLALCCPGQQLTLFNAGGYRPVGSPRIPPSVPAEPAEPSRLEVSPSPEGITHRMAEITGRDESSFSWLELDMGASSPYDPPLTQADASGLTARLLLALGLPRTPLRTLRIISPTPASPRAEATQHATEPEHPSASGMSFVSHRSIATLVRASKKALRKAERVGDSQGMLKEVR
jgi:hypothetical protein